MVKLLRSRAAPTSDKPQVRFRMRVTVAEVIAIGPGKVALLEAVRDHGSISAAAKQLDMSYRRAWVLVDETNRSLKKPAVESGHGGQNGGGTALTPVGEQVIALYRTIEEKAAAACATELKALTRLLAPPPSRDA